MNISIIIAAFNTAKYIEQCLDSIINQTYFRKYDVKYEILIGIDACESTKIKIDDIKYKYKDLIIYYFYENSGPYNVLNELIKNVKYENILRFDSDDFMIPTMIEKIINHNNKCDLIRFMYYEYFNDNNIKSILNHHAHGTIFFNKKILLELGGYKNWRCSADSDFLKRFRMLKKYKECLINERLFYYRRHDNNLTKIIPMSKRGKYHKEINNIQLNDLFIDIYKYKNKYDRYE